MRVTACTVLMAQLAPLAAQSVSTTISAVTPLNLHATDGTVTGTTTVPAGPLPGFAFNFAAAPGVLATVSHYRETTATRAFGYVAFGAEIFAGSTSSNARSGPHEFLLEFTATGPAPARLTLHRETTSSVGAPWPLVQVDVANDGTIDVANLSAVTDWQLDVPTLGSQPFRIRVIADATLVGLGQSSTQVWFDLEPSNGLELTKVVTGCDQPVFPTFAVAPAFADRGVDVYADAGVFRVVVIGLSPQPAVLPSPLPGPCLFLPALDLVFFPTGSVSSVVHVPLPAAVRPVTFFAQAVELFDFGTTDAYRVVAQ